MKLALAALVAVALAVPASGQTRVRGYVKKDGTYVAPHMRSSPNSTRLDNYSTAPNYNPYTGRQGTQNPYPTPTYRAPTYSPPEPPKAPCFFAPCPK